MNTLLLYRKYEVRVTVLFDMIVERKRINVVENQRKQSRMDNQQWTQDTEPI